MKVADYNGIVVLRHIKRVTVSKNHSGKIVTTTLLINNRDIQLWTTFLDNFK